MTLLKFFGNIPSGEKPNYLVNCQPQDNSWLRQRTFFWNKLQVKTPKTAPPMCITKPGCQLSAGKPRPQKHMGGGAQAPYSLSTTTRWKWEWEKGHQQNAGNICECMKKTPQLTWDSLSSTATTRSKFLPVILCRMTYYCKDISFLLNWSIHSHRFFWHKTGLFIT